VSTFLVPPELLPCRKDRFRRKSQIVGTLACAASHEGVVVYEPALTRILMKSDDARLTVGSRSLQHAPFACVSMPTSRCKVSLPTAASSAETLAAVLG
jgi:hypothetical protein